MKKNYLMFLLFCALGVFVSCSDDDKSDPEPDPDPKPEKPTYVVVSEFAIEGKPQEMFGQTFTPVDKNTFTYNADGKLISQKVSGISNSGTELLPYDWTFAYGTNQITITAPDDDMGEKRNKTTMTLDNGSVKTMVIEYYRSEEKETCTLTYTADGYLQKLESTTPSEGSDPYVFTEEFEYKDGNLVKYTYTKGEKRKDIYTFKYGNGTYKNSGTIDLFSTYSDIFMSSSAPLMLGVAGKRSEKLPVSVNLVSIYLEDNEQDDLGDVTYSYNVADGLVVSYTQSDDTDNTYKITYKK